MPNYDSNIIGSAMYFSESSFPMVTGHLTPLIVVDCTSPGLGLGFRVGIVFWVLLQQQIAYQAPGNSLLSSKFGSKAYVKVHRCPIVAFAVCSTIKLLLSCVVQLKDTSFLCICDIQS